MSASASGARGLPLAGALLWAACAAAGEAPPAPTATATARTMAVPPALLARTSMPEASGAVWCPELGRYLIISDDTGQKGEGTNHAPWLFAMSKDGALDAEPVPLRGVERLNDAEAICAGDGVYYLTTSHSPDRKGRDRAERRQLLRLVVDGPGRALRVTGALDLAAALQEAGLLPGPSVDIEALAYRGGALYVGLKWPLGGDGAALILRAEGIEQALSAGRLPRERLARFAAARLAVEGAAGPVLQGISDMTFLPDGSLALLGNSPKRMPHDGGGALWQLRPGAAPRLLRRFPGEKPEGVTLTADRRALLIVLDRDRRVPSWTTQPLPAASGGPAGGPGGNQ